MIILQRTVLENYLKDMPYFLSHVSCHTNEVKDISRIKFPQ
jgi:hypothetical protein